MLNPVAWFHAPKINVICKEYEREESMLVNAHAIAERLVTKGKELFDAPVDIVQFTSDEKPNRLLNNLNEYPHAFVLACVMDRQMKAELAWLIPYRFATKLGSFKFSTLESLTIQDIRVLMTEPAHLHRFPEKMSKVFFEAISTIRNRYGGNAAQIWANRPSSAKVVYEFLQFRGAGPKIATMAANILARELKVPFSDYFSIDISVDVHVRRVLGRLGLVNSEASIEEIIYRVRSLHPEFPGLMDFPAWEIGRNWCKPKQPLCKECYMRDLCHYTNNS